MNQLNILRNGLLVVLGYMLSPLSWWNDIFFNLPIALCFGYSVRWLEPSWFVPAIVLGYWLSNVLGMIMMQFGAVDMILPDSKRNLSKELWIGIGSSTLYTVAIAALLYFHILDIPEFLTHL